MKYFYDFRIVGTTAFTRGITVLSDENGTSQLSFIKPDGSVQARLYKAMNNEDLPPGPVNLLLLTNQNMTVPTMLGYWIYTRNGGVHLDGNTLQKDKTLADNFFEAPESINVGSAKAMREGAALAVINGRLYGGTTSTWDQAPTYGMFGLPAAGDYEISSSFVYNNVKRYFVTFDVNRKQFLRFNLYGEPTYGGTSYNVIGDVFDPKNVQMDLVHLEQVNAADCFAFCRASDGKLYELNFGIEFAGPFQIEPKHKRLFVLQDEIKPDSKWVASQGGVFYISSGDKIYRYNPINQQKEVLTTTFAGKTISMLKLVSTENASTLIVGIEGSLVYLDVSTGKRGDELERINGIPGAPVDMVER